MVPIGSEFLPGFTLHDVEVGGGINIRAAVGGAGPPVLLLHGHPQTHIAWRKVAPLLADRFTVVAADLRGYGDSSKPDGGPGHADYAKRAMAADQVALMRALGHTRFGLAGHDRGGRVAHRLALDHPGPVSALALLDIAPTATMYARTDQAFATKYFWWFFLIQPEPLPERLIGADPEWFLGRHMAGQSKSGEVVEPEAFAEYLRCYLDPRTRHAICEDYRAAATLDLVHDAEDAHARIQAPVLALWGDKGVVGQTYDVFQTWAEKALRVEGLALDCGHAMPEERPQAVADALAGLFAANL